MEDQRLPEKRSKMATKKTGHAVSDSTEANTDQVHTKDPAEFTEASKETSVAAKITEQTLEESGKRPFAFY